MNSKRLSFILSFLCGAAVFAACFSTLGARSQQGASAQFATTSPATKHTPPADGEHAADALKNSPRHGEWVDIDLPMPAGAAGQPSKLHTWVTYPERSGKAPIVIVIHEIFGMTDWVRGVADQLAAEGFIAVSPDLLSGKGPQGGNTDSFPGDKVREAIGKLTTEEKTQRLDAVRAWALAQPASSGKSASIGFCWGGSASFEYATNQAGLQAAVVYYGTAPTQKEALNRISCRVLGLYAGDDARVTSTVEPTAKTMEELRKPFTHEVYDGAGHGFLRQQTGRDGANSKAAHAAWDRTVEFLKANLE